MIAKLGHRVTKSTDDHWMTRDLSRLNMSRAGSDECDSLKRTATVPHALNMLDFFGHLHTGSASGSTASVTRFARNYFPLCNAQVSV